MSKMIIMPEQSANIIHLPVTVYCNPMNQLIMRSEPFNPEASLQFSDKNKPKDDVDFSRSHCNIESKFPEKMKAIGVNNKSIVKITLIEGQCHQKPKQRM